MVNSAKMKNQTLSLFLAQYAPYLLIAPPRSCSTVFSRALSQHSGIEAYFHEPCGRYFYENTTQETIIKALEGLKPSCLIKEMSFQFRNLPMAMSFLHHARNPPVFLVRDPHLTLESRVRMVLGDLASEPATTAAQKKRISEAIETKDYAGMEDLLTENVFPISRTGWDDIGAQMDACRKDGLPFVVVEANSFRREPSRVLARLCEFWGLPFETGMLSWESRRQSPLGALSRHEAWYKTVVESRRVLPPEDEEIQAEQFPKRFRAHLPRAFEIYQTAMAHEYVL